jgi:hypothetical protein
MTRLYGWAPRGHRLVAKVPHGHWKTATFLAALRNDRIDAPCVFDGPINGERFLAYVEQFLVPTLKRNDIVVLDNLGSHKGKAVRNAIKAAGARLLFLPNTHPTSTIPPMNAQTISLAQVTRPSRCRMLWELDPMVDKRPSKITAAPQLPGKVRPRIRSGEEWGF